MIGKILGYFKESKEELTKVIWPTKKQTFEMTIAVIIIVVITGVFLGVSDYILNELTSILIGG